MTSRWVKRYMTEAGFVASCRCGWSTTRQTRTLRDNDADAHETSHVWTDPIERTTP
jgi:hypothetical protein